MSGEASERDAGAVVIFVAIALLALLAMVAIVIDLGSTRSVRREARTAADAGAAAGSLTLATPNITVCTHALAYTFLGLGGTQPSASEISTACAPLTASCSGTAARESVPLTVDGVTVTMTNPVPDGSSLMAGTSLASGVAQPAAASDGSPCERVGVTITRAQSSFFSGAVSSSSKTFTVHSVARYDPLRNEGVTTPALVALNQTTCSAIDAGNNGRIVLGASAAGPGIAYSDSDGPSCTGTNPILQAFNAGRLVAESSGDVIGELGWYLAPGPPTKGYNTGSSTYQLAPATVGSTSANYVGLLTSRPERTTRDPVDKVYHCMNLPSATTPRPATCSDATDPIKAYQTLAAASTSSAPAGYNTHSGCSTSGVVVLTGKVWVDCAGGFSVSNGTLQVTGGSSVIFRGGLSVAANGSLRVNDTTATTDAGGYPVPTSSGSQTSLIVNSTAANAISVSTASSSVYMAQTAIYNRGGFDLSGGPVVSWTPHADGIAKGLLYWSESTQRFSLQGGPDIKAKGVVFHGLGQLFAAGNGTIDLTNVQMWVDRTSLQGTPVLKLAPDPDNSITTHSPGSVLIR